MTARHVLALIAGLLAVGATSGCVGACDLISDRKTKSLPKGYCLELMLETKTQRLQDCSGDHPVRSMDSVFGDELQRIGWNDRVIVGSRLSTRGDPEWLILDLESDVITGPISEEAMKDRLTKDILLRGLATRKVEEVLH